MPKKPATPSTQVAVLDASGLTLTASEATAKLAQTLGTGGIAEICDQGELLQYASLAHNLLAGFALCGVKAQAKHGEFQNRLLEVRDRLKNANGKRGSTLKGDDKNNATRQLRTYQQAAAFCLRAIEQGDDRVLLATELKTALPARIPAGVNTVGHLLSLPKDELLAICQKIAAGMSLRKFLAFMRLADRAAEVDENREANRPGLRRSLSADEKNAAELREAEQLYFEEIIPRVHECFMVDHPSFERLPRAQRQQLADALRAAAKRVEKSL